MGNCCSNLNDKLKPHVTILPINEFRNSFKTLEFPKNIAFTGDPSIFRLRRSQTRELYILKRISFPTESELEAYKQGLDAAIQLEHDNILKVYHYSIEKNQLNDLAICYTLNIVLENFSHTLQDEIRMCSKAKESFTEGDIQQCMNGLADALEFLQLKGLNHGDINPLTIYIAKEKKVKIMFLGSFSSEKVIQNQDLSCRGYMSPQVRSQAAELLFSSPVNSPTKANPLWNPFKADVFSLGLVVLDMMCGEDKSSEIKENYRENIKRKFKAVQSQKKFGPFLCGVLKAMLRENEMTRPDFLELKKMLMFQEYLGTSTPIEPELQETEDFLEKGKANKKVQDKKSPDDPRIFEESDTDENNSFGGILKLNASGFEESGEDKDESKSQKSSAESLHNHNALNSDKKNKATLGEVNDCKLQHYESSDREIDMEAKNYDESVVENEEQLYSLYQKEIKTFHKLIINLEENELVEDVCNMLQEVIGWQHSLKELVLSMPKANLSDEKFKAICNGISRLDDLAMCYFDFRKSNMTDFHLEKLIKSLLKQYKLDQVALNFSDNNITVEGCRKIAYWLNNLNEVKSLALNIGGNHVGNEGIIAIGKELGKMAELESLTMFLYSSDFEGKEGVTALLNGISELENLEKINLNLVGNLLKDEELDVILEFTHTSEVGEIIIDLKDNCVSEEGRRKAKIECVQNENVIIRF